jgi:hypothetical protein
VRKFSRLPEKQFSPRGCNTPRDIRRGELSRDKKARPPRLARRDLRIPHRGGSHDETTKSWATCLYLRARLEGGKGRKTWLAKNGLPDDCLLRCDGALLRGADIYDTLQLLWHVTLFRRLKPSEVGEGVTGEGERDRLKTAPRPPQSAEPPDPAVP